MAIRQICGEIEVDSYLIDVTDPCYSASVKCRINNVHIENGTYICYVDIEEERIARSYIVLEDYDIDELDFSECLGTIGVDSGLAGYFNSPKPDFSDDGWRRLCSWMDSSSHYANGVNECFITVLSENNRDAFWTQSGWGDGGYDVYGTRGDSGLYIALSIEFFE